MKFFIIFFLIVCSLSSLKNTTSNILNPSSNTSNTPSSISNTFQGANLLYESNFVPKKVNYHKDVSKLEVSIQESTPTSLTLNIVDNNEDTFWFNDLFSIAKLEDGTYKGLKRLIPDRIYDSDGITLKHSTINVVKFNWEKIYGELSPGQYKLYWILDNYVYCEMDFTIE